MTDDLVNRREWAEELDMEIKAIANKLKTGIVDLVIKLTAMHENHLYRELGYGTIREYCIGAHIYEDRMGYHIQKIVGNHILSRYIHEHPEEAKEIGVSKFIELASAADLVDETNIYAWAKDAKDAKTVKELRDQIDAVEHGIDYDGHPITFSCLFTRREAWQLLQDTIEITKRMTNAESDAYALEQICADFISAHPDSYGLLLQERGESTE